jgi:hypothetical protein
VLVLVLVWVSEVVVGAGAKSACVDVCLSAAEQDLIVSKVSVGQKHIQFMLKQ